MTKPARRAILGAIACTPVLAVSCSHQPAAAAKRIDRSQWDSLMAKRDALDAIYDAHHQMICAPYFDLARQRFGDVCVFRDDPRRAEYEQWSARSGYDAACDEGERISKELCAVQCALMELPAPGPKELFWKLENTFDGGGTWSDEVEAGILADARRFLVGEA